MYRAPTALQCNYVVQQVLSCDSLNVRARKSRPACLIAQLLVGLVSAFHEVVVTLLGCHMRI